MSRGSEGDKTELPDPESLSARKHTVT